MKKFFLLVCMTFLSIFGALAQTPPITSTAGNDVWYYIQCIPRSTDLNAKWLTGGAEGTILTNTVLTANNDAQLWKVVANAGGIGLVNKLSGSYMNSDGTAYTTDLRAALLTCVNAAPSTGLKLLPYVDQNSVINGYYLVNNSATEPVNNTQNTSLTFQFYSAGVNSDYRPVNYGTFAPNVNSAIKFMLPKDILMDAMTTAEKGLNSTFEGINPGQYTAEVRDGLRSLIDAARLVYDDTNSSNADYFASLNEITSIYALYKSQINMPAESTNINEIWYLLKSTRPENAYLTSTGADALVMANTFVLNDNSQLWKIVKNTSGTENGFTLVNKATGQYLNTDVTDVVQVNTVSTMPTTQLRFLVSNEVTANASRFWIQNTSGEANNFLMHTGSGSKVWNWVGGADDNSTWLFVNPMEAFYLEFNLFVDKMKEITSSLYPTGTGEGEFSGAMWTAFETQRTAAIEMVKSESGSEPSTKTQIDDMVLALNTALDNLNASRNFPVTFSTADNQIYYTIADRRPTTNYWKVGAKDAITAQLLITTTLESTNPEYLFRFEKAPGTVDSCLIYSKAYPTTPLAVIGATSDNVISADPLAIPSVWAITRTFDKHPSFSNIVSTTTSELTASYHNAMFVGFWTPDYEDVGNDWKFVRSQLSEVKAISATELGVYVLNKKIVSKNPSLKLNVWNIMGQKINTKLELSKGIYLVQVEGKKGTVKLFVD